MIPLASDSTQYQNVFGLVPSTNYPLGIGACVVFLVGIGLLFFGTGLSPRKPGVKLAISGLVLTVVGLLSVMLVSIPRGDLDAHIKANIQQKYGATVDDNSSFPASDDALSQPFQYKLDFPNGTSGLYSIRFARDTSEPFLVESDAPVAPTTQQLEQSAKK